MVINSVLLYSFDSKQISSWSLSTIVTVTLFLGPALTPREEEDGGMDNFTKYSLRSFVLDGNIGSRYFPAKVGWKMAADE